MRMNIRNVLLHLPYHNETIFNFCHSLLLRQARRTRRNEKKSCFDADEIIRKNGLNGLEIMETEVFPGKKNVVRIRDSRGRNLILKTGKIDPFQSRLFVAAKAIEKHLCFRVPALVDHGNGWILTEEVEGKYLNGFFDSNPEYCINVSNDVSDDYRVIIKELKAVQSPGNLLQDGSVWLFSMLNLWSKPIIDAGLIDFHLVKNLASEFQGIIDRKGERAFEWCHGNVIGDHVIVSEDGDMYLLDLNVVPRFGRGYHDFLRAIDFMIVKSERDKEIFDALPLWIDAHLSEFDRREVMLTLAFRLIGILGWDILHNKAGSEQIDIEAKKLRIARFIREAVY